MRSNWTPHSPCTRIRVRVLENNVMQTLRCEIQDFVETHVHLCKLRNEDASKYVSPGELLAHDSVPVSGRGLSRVDGGKYFSRRIEHGPQ